MKAILALIAGLVVGACTLYLLKDKFVPLTETDQQPTAVVETKGSSEVAAGRATAREPETLVAVDKEAARNRKLFSKLDAILENEELENHVVAQQILKIAASRSTNVSVRREALTHGLTLVDDESYEKFVIGPILLNSDSPPEMLEEVWDDLFDRETDSLLESSAKKLAEDDGHHLQETAAEWIADFGSSPN